MTQTELANMARDGAFQARVGLLMVKAALAKLAAAQPSAEDKLLGQSILDGREPVLQWALGCCSNPSIAAGAHSASGDTIPDADLEFTVNSLWDAFAV